VPDKTHPQRSHPAKDRQAEIDFDFIYKQVQESYGYNGNVSVSPPVILKTLRLLILHNVRSERE
jgi:hypothetical protein